MSTAAGAFRGKAEREAQPVRAVVVDEVSTAHPAHQPPSRDAELLVHRSDRCCGARGGQVSKVGRERGF